MKTTRLLCLLAVLSLGQAWAQGSSEYKAGIKIPLDQEGKKYIRFITWNQMWMRATQNNPGTTNAEGTPQNWTPDLGVRRARALWYAQISPRYLVLTHIGINNQTFVNGGAPGATGVGGYGAGKKPQVFLHDFWNEYRVFRTDKESADGKSKTEHNSLYIGAGLHYWNGVSRMASASTLSFLAVDAPVWNWYNIETTDQFARQFGVYAKGKLASKIDYRLSMNKPFYTDERTTASTTGVNADSTKSRSYLYPNGNFSYGGYVSYQLWDQEANLLPFTVGTYCGTKKVFNIGGGFYYHPKASAHYVASGTPDPVTGLARIHNQLNWALDVFMDRPIGENGLALTVYGLFQSNNYGQNYYRTVGIMNTGAGPYVKNSDGSAATFDPTTASIDGYGNARALTGTGNIAMIEAGLMLPKNIFGEKTGALCRFQPYVMLTSKQLDWLTVNGLDGRVGCWDAGMNFLMDGHHSKITVQWSQRPVVSRAADATLYKNGNRGELIIQAQVYL